MMTDILLTELDPQWLKWIDDTHFRCDAVRADADGILFLCPRCFVANGRRRPGVESVICWRPHIPQTTDPVPGRWEFQGSDFTDLTLVAGSSSIALTGECVVPGVAKMPGWHGFIRNGVCTNA